MNTKLTEEERYQLLMKMQEAMGAVTEALTQTKEELVETKNKLSQTASMVETSSLLWNQTVQNIKEFENKTEQSFKEFQKNINNSIRLLKQQVNEFKEESDRFKQHSKGIEESLEARLITNKERFDNLNRSIDILQVGIKGLRETDFNRLNERINDLPNLETIRKELSDSTSPLVTKGEFHSLSQRIATIEGDIKSNLRNNFLGLFIVLITLLGSNYFFISRVISDAKMSNIQTPSSSQSTPASPQPSPTISSPLKSTP